MRRRAPIALSLLLLALSTGCASGASPVPKAPGAASAPEQAALAADYSTVDNQYRQIRIGLVLPDGVNFPEHLRNTSAHYPLDAGTVTAQNYWLCAWLQAYLNGTPSARKPSEQLPKYVRMDAYTKALDARGRSAVDTALRDARNGAKKTVAAFTQASCGGPFYGHARPNPGTH